MWYGFDIGLVHFISYSTEVYYTDGEAYAGEQYKWLKEDLEKANRWVTQHIQSPSIGLNKIHLCICANMWHDLMVSSLEW